MARAIMQHSELRENVARIVNLARDLSKGTGIKEDIDRYADIVSTWSAYLDKLNKI